MKKPRFLLIGLVILVLINIGIHNKERLLAEGAPLLLKLAPLDPRSLMQGDYMALRYQIEAALKKQEQKPIPANGRLLLNLDANRVGSLAGLDDGQALQANQLRIRYRMRKGRLRIAGNSYFFEEGTASRYRQARYGEFRVAENGDAILTALRDEKLKPLGTEQDTPPSAH